MDKEDKTNKMEKDGFDKIVNDAMDEEISQKIAVEIAPKHNDEPFQAETKLEAEIKAAIKADLETDKADNVTELELNQDIKNNDIEEVENIKDNEVTENIETDNSIEEFDDVKIEWVPTSKKSTKKKKSKLSNIIYNVVRYAVMLVALFVFGYASYELTLIYVESREAEDLKSSTADMFYVSLDDLREDYESATNSEGETISLENANDGKLFVFDYDKMLSYNSHSKGYIRQEDGVYIDNPIVQHPTDNEYYLTHLVDHRKSSIGAIYIDSAITEGLNAKNCIIYGHNIAERAGKIMFGSLNWYWNKTGYYKEHPTFDIWIEDTRYRYYVFAIYKTEASGSPVYQYSFSSDEEFMNYIDMCKKNSKYTFKTAPKLTKDSHIITLSTCTHTDELRMIVQLVRGEKLDIYGNPVNAE